MKKYFLSLIFLSSVGSLCAMGRDVRLTPAGQYEYFRVIPSLIEGQNFDEARERINFLRTASRSFVSTDQLDLIEAQLETAIRDKEDMRAYEREQARLLQDYNTVEQDMYHYRDRHDIDSERSSLMGLWEIAQNIDREPLSLPAHMVRLFQIESCSLASSKKDDRLIIDLITYFERTHDKVAHDAFELMYYGDASGRCVSPFQRLHGEAKRLYDSDLVRATQLLEFLMLVGDESLRNRATIFLATGEDPEGVAEEEHIVDLPMRHVLDWPVAERVAEYLSQAGETIDEAFQLAELNQDREAVAQLAQIVTDEALARSLARDFN